MIPSPIPTGRTARRLEWPFLPPFLRKLIEQRWILAEQSEGAIPTPLIVLLVAWLTLIFASFGFRAPRNGTVVFTCLISGALAAAAVTWVRSTGTKITETFS